MCVCMCVCVCVLLKQKADQENSMDTTENDSTTEHSIPNNSEGAEVQTCWHVLPELLLTYNQARAKSVVYEIKHINTILFNSPQSGTARLSQCQKGKTN